MYNWSRVSRRRDNMSQKHWHENKHPDDDASDIILDDLTAEDHIRLADEAEDDSVDMEVVLEWLDAKIKQLRSEITAKYNKELIQEMSHPEVCSGEQVRGSGGLPPAADRHRC
jgi:hypothetical protein